MKLVMLLYLSVLFIGCKSKKDTNEILAGSKTAQVKKFEYNLDKTPLLFINVMVNDKFPAVFIVDNGTDKNDQIILDREFARKFILKDSSFIAQIKFSNDSIATVSFDSFLVKSNHTYRFCFMLTHHSVLC